MGLPAGGATTLIAALLMLLKCLGVQTKIFQSIENFTQSMIALVSAISDKPLEFLEAGKNFHFTHRRSIIAQDHTA